MVVHKATHCSIQQFDFPSHLWKWVAPVRLYQVSYRFNW